MHLSINYFVLFYLDLPNVDKSSSTLLPNPQSEHQVSYIESPVGEIQGGGEKHALSLDLDSPALQSIGAAANTTLVTSGEGDVGAEGIIQNSEDLERLEETVVRPVKDRKELKNNSDSDEVLAESDKSIFRK